MSLLGRYLFCKLTYHLVLADSFSSLDGPIQAGLPNVDVLRVKVAGEELDQHPHIDVVVIIHVAKPPNAVTTSDRWVRCNKTGAPWYSGSTAAKTLAHDLGSIPIGSGSEREIESAFHPSKVSELRLQRAGPAAYSLYN